MPHDLPTPPERVDSDLHVHELYLAGRLDDAEYRAAMRRRGTLEVTATLAMPSVSRDVPVEGTYFVLGELGRGAMGTVPFAKDGLLRRKVAYKRIGLNAGFDPAVVRRFIAEAQITAQLEHPNIVPVYAVHNSADGELAFAMKLVDGSTLGQIVKTARAGVTSSPAWQEIRARKQRLEHFLRVCDAIAYAHDRGVIHRDLKPANIMVGAHHEVYVMDWGIARLIGDTTGEGAGSPDDPSPDASMTQAGEAIGTPMYMSPEQARGEREIGPASDQYALGLVLQELVTLQPAARSRGGVHAALVRAASGQRSAFEHVDPRIGSPRELVAIVTRATAATPPERYASVDDLAADVRAYLLGDEVTALPDDVARRLARWVGRNREVVIAAIGAIVLLAALSIAASLGYAWWQSAAAHRDERRVAAAHAAASHAAGAVEAEMLRYGRLLEGLSAAATIVLSQSEPEAGPHHLASALREPLGEPRDGAGSPRSPGEVSSLDHPTFLLPPGEDPTSFARQIGQLARLREALFRSLVRSDPGDVTELSEEEQQRLIRESGVPISRIQIALDDGLALLYPGRAQDPGDLRGEPWYRDAAGRRFLHWGTPRRDGQGLSVSCSRSIYGEDIRTFIGVAAMDVVIGAPVEARLTPEGDDVRDAFLLDGEGRILARSTGPGDLSLFPFPDIRAALRPNVSGQLERIDEEGREELVIFTPIENLGWYHVARFSE